MSVVVSKHENRQGISPLTGDRCIRGCQKKLGSPGTKWSPGVFGAGGLSYVLLFEGAHRVMSPYYCYNEAQRLLVLENDLRSLQIVWTAGTLRPWTGGSEGGHKTLA